MIQYTVDGRRFMSIIYCYRLVVDVGLVVAGFGGAAVVDNPYLQSFKTQIQGKQE